jgi:hypothetical protein
MSKQETERVGAKVNRDLWAAFTSAATAAGMRPTMLVGGFIEWWMADGPTPTRPEWQAGPMGWEESTQITLTLPKGTWKAFKDACDRTGYVRTDLIERFARWYIGDESLPPRRGQQLGHD